MSPKINFSIWKINWISDLFLVTGFRAEWDAIEKLKNWNPKTERERIQTNCRLKNEFENDKIGAFC